MSSPFDLGVFDRKASNSNFQDFDFLAELDRNQPGLDKSNSFFSGGDKHDFSLGDFPDPEPIEVDRRSRNTSDIFRLEKPDSNAQQDEANRSRHLQDISIEGAEGTTSSRFVYVKKPPAFQPPNDESFELLNRVVREPKPKDFNDFFKELSEDNKQNPNDSFLKREMYSNREEFEEYLRNLKLEKRRAEQRHQLEEQFREKEDVFAKPRILQQQKYTEFESLQPPTGEAGGKSASSIASGSNFQQKYSSSVRPPIGFESESQGTNKSNSQDLRQGQYLDKQSKPKEDVFDQFDFGDLNNASPKHEYLDVERKESYQFGQQGSDFFADSRKESEPGIGSLQIRSNVQSNRQFDRAEDNPFDAGMQPSIDVRKSESKIASSKRELDKPATPPPTITVQPPSREFIGSPPQFEKLLEDDMLNPYFDEAAIAQQPQPQAEPEQPVVQATESKPASSSKTLPPSKPGVKLTTIRQENSNIFEKTVEEEKLAKLLQNYEKMKSNFDALISEMKVNSEGQQRIMNELAALKHDYSDSKELTVQQLDEERRLRMEAIKDKELKVLELKKELQTIRADERTQVERQICERIASLEEVVRKSFEEMNSDKRECMVWVNPELSRAKEAPPAPQEEIPDRFSERASDENLFVQSRNVPQHSLAESLVDQIYSPLQLRLDNIQSPAAEEKLQQSRKVPAFEFSPATTSRRYEGECYKPRPQHFDHYLKLACVHDQAVIYESFDFLVSCRYSVVKSSGRKVLKLTVTLRNKTVLTLSDLIIVVYGSVGEALSVNPARIYAQRLPPDELITFEAFLSNIVVDSHHINMQLSYRSEALSKKKLQVRVPRPLTKFFDMQFTHEDQFKSIWKGIQLELYVEARLLNFRAVKSSEDLKALLPFVEVSEQDEHEFSLGLLFQLFNIEGLFLLKLLCSTDGRASLHLRYEHEHQHHFGERVLDTINALLFD